MTNKTETTPKTFSDAFFDGYLASQRGLPSEFNPYSMDTQSRSRESWHKGWVASDLRLEENEW